MGAGVVYVNRARQSRLPTVLTSNSAYHNLKDSCQLEVRFTCHFLRSRSPALSASGTVH